MIKVIDRLKYLPKDKKSILDGNEVMNLSFKSIVENIKKKAKRINTNGKLVTVEVVGTIKKTNPKIEVVVKNCDDEALIKKIQSELLK